MAGWKTRRSKGRIAANPDDDVRDITRQAFAAPERLQHRALTLLKGIGVPTATALLAVVFPRSEHDHRCAQHRGVRAARLSGRHGGYRTYLGVCRRLADEAALDARTLDRALWQWSKGGFPS